MLPLVLQLCITPVSLNAHLESKIRGARRFICKLIWHRVRVWTVYEEWGCTVEREVALSSPLRLTSILNNHIFTTQ